MKTERNNALLEYLNFYKELYKKKSIIYDNVLLIFVRKPAYDLFEDAIQNAYNKNPSCISRLVKYEKPGQSVSFGVAGDDSIGKIMIDHIKTIDLSFK